MDYCSYEVSYYVNEYIEGAHDCIDNCNNKVWFYYPETTEST